MNTSATTTDSGDDSSECASSKRNSSTDEDQTKFVKNCAAGWIKAKGLLFERNVTESPCGNAATTPPSISKAFFSNISPEMCVDLLRHSSPRIYKNIRKRIASADNEWMEGFFRADGLHVLLETLEELTDPRRFTVAVDSAANAAIATTASLSDVLLPLYCVECVKAIMKNSQSMEQILNYPDCAYKIVQAIGSEKLAVRINAVQLLSALAYYSERGCSLTLEALQKYQKKLGKKYWSEILINELSTTYDIDYKASLMALINCVMFNVEFTKRIQIRAELLAVGLKELLPILTSQSDPTERLSVQLNLFNDCRQKDEYPLALVNDHYDLVKTILNKIHKTPRSMKFLTILQSLSLLDSDTFFCEKQWDLMEHFAALVSSMDALDSKCATTLTSIEFALRSLFNSRKDESVQTDQPRDFSNSIKSTSRFRRRLSAILGSGRETSNNSDSTPMHLIRSPSRSPVSSKKRGKIRASVIGSSNVLSRHISRNIKTELMKHTATCIPNKTKNFDESSDLDIEQRPKENDAIETLQPGSSQSFRHLAKDRLSSNRNRSFSTLLLNGTCSLMACKKLNNEDKTDGDADKSDGNIGRGLGMLPGKLFFCGRKSSDPTADRSLISGGGNIEESRGGAHQNIILPRNGRICSIIDDKEGKVKFATVRTQPGQANGTTKSSAVVRASSSGDNLAKNLSEKFYNGKENCKSRSGIETKSHLGGPPPSLSPAPPPPPPPPPLPPPAPNLMTMNPNLLKNSRSGLNLAATEYLDGGCSTAPSSAQHSPIEPSADIFAAILSSNKCSQAASATNANFNERFYTFPIKKVKKTKTIYWNKVAPNVIKQKHNNIWAESSDFTVDQLNLPQIEEMFSCEPPPASRVAEKAQVRMSSPKSTKLGSSSIPKVFDQVYILDQKTSLKISLFLKQFRGISFEDIVQVVVDSTKNQDNAERSSVVSLERLRGLQRCLSGAEHYITEVQNCECDYNRLGMAEKFLWHVGRNSFFCLRLEVACLQREYDDKLNYFSDSFDSLIDCCKMLRNSESLKKFLYVTLTVGNYLNLGSSNGSAAGFKISSIKQLYSLKATGEYGFTLLHVIVENAERIEENTDENDALFFARELADVHTAAKIDFETAKAELSAWVSEIRKLIEMVNSTCDNDFIDSSIPFLKKVDNSLKDLTKNKLQEVDQAAKSLQDYFCDDTKLMDMLALFSELLRSIQQAKVDNGQRRLKKAKQQNDKQQCPIQEARKGVDFDPSNASLQGKQENLVENLLMKICEGNISPKTGTSTIFGDPKVARVSASSSSQHNRNFAKSVITDQSRERTISPSNSR